MKISLELMVLHGRRVMGRFPSVFPKGRSVRYIERQEEHHRRYSFAEEMKKFLDVHGIEE
jgi:hypothetical protein